MKFWTLNILTNVLVDSAQPDANNLECCSTDINDQFRAKNWIPFTLLLNDNSTRL